MENSIEITRPLLSLCIPTCNRADIIRESVLNLLSLPSFTDEVQLVISDNASTDKTEQVIKDIIINFPDKNIKYHRNNINIADQNFLKVLNYGDGIYCKLLNDYVVLTEPILNRIVNKVKKYKGCDTNKTWLNFYFDIRGIYSKRDEIIFNNVNDFILALNNKLTWIANFGCFKQQLNGLSVYENQSHLMMLQLFWSLHLAKTRKTLIVCQLTGLKYIPIPNSKRVAVYNFFTPHVKNYYYIISQFTQLSKSELRFDKTRLLSDFVGSKIIDYLILKRESPFDTKGSWTILWNHFKEVPYFYYFIPVKLTKAVLKKLKRILINFKDEKNYNDNNRNETSKTKR